MKTLNRGKDSKAKKACKYMTKPEPLTVEYDLKNWFNTSYTGNDVDKLAISPQGKREHRGLFRKSVLCILSNNEENE